MRTWATAMQEALHEPPVRSGPSGIAHAGGFYRRGRGPGTDFRTAATLAPDLLADAFAVLFARLPPDRARTVVEIGAGSGALLAALGERLPPEVRLVGVEQRPRPPGLPDRVRWRAEPPTRFRGLLLAVEWLDTQPVDVVVGGRTLMVQPDGTQLPGQAPTSRDEAWLRRWWPDGDRREVGHRRDDAWAAAVRRLRAGIAVAVDYGHTRDCRPSSGSLAGYAAGRTVSALPDGHRDVTAAVALDACAAAVAADRPELAERSLITTQRAALRALGIEGRLPARPADGTAGAEYAADLQRAARAGRLLDPDGLGGFGWLLHAVDVPPATLSLLGCRP